MFLPLYLALPGVWRVQRRISILIPDNEAQMSKTKDLPVVGVRSGNRFFYIT